MDNQNNNPQRATNRHSLLDDIAETENINRHRTLDSEVHANPQTPLVIENTQNEFFEVHRNLMLDPNLHTNPQVPVIENMSNVSSQVPPPPLLTRKINIAPQRQPIANPLEKNRHSRIFMQ